MYILLNTTNNDDNINIICTLQVLMLILYLRRLHIIQCWVAKVSTCFLKSSLTFDSSLVLRRSKLSSLNGEHISNHLTLSFILFHLIFNFENVHRKFVTCQFNVLTNIESLKAPIEIYDTLMSSDGTGLIGNPISSKAFTLLDGNNN